MIVITIWELTEQLIVLISDCSLLLSFHNFLEYNLGRDLVCSIILSSSVFCVLSPFTIAVMF